MRIIDLAVALTVFIGSAGVTALLTVLLIHCGLGVPPAVLGLNALISAGVLSFVLVVAMFGGLTRGRSSWRIIAIVAVQDRGLENVQ
ncbi:hypothetical protein ACH79_26780 [Bradyrhizobium sp. CCBAU 051011]|nr:hypothetical protein ACH79_26780 [Bradyrhizobium sp. CCBAU 051011]